MRIEELTSEQSITLLVIAGNQRLEFPSSVLETFPRKHMILAAPVLRDDKIVSFNGDGVVVHLIASFTEQKPHIFQNVTVQSAKKDDDSFCYIITAPTESKEFNRRGAYRYYSGIDTLIRVGTDHSTVNITIKDISNTGFSFTAASTDNEFHKGETVHAVLNDYIEESDQKYGFHFFGIIVRTYSLENGNVVYGCQFTGKIPGLEHYLMEKERLRLRKARGSNNVPPKKGKK